MSTEGLRRKLAAILSADVKGYSRLMGEDEEWTIRTLNAHKGAIRTLVGQHRGRVVDAPGDNVLAEFGSVVDAVQCAVEIQQVLKAKNALLPATRRMEFRIGINLGDVIEEEDRIYGDGVNIAARLEGLADPGGICISGSAYEQIENKLPLQYDFMGEHEVKNIARPVKAYRARMEGEAEAKAEAEEDGRRRAQSARRRPLVIGALAAVVVLVGAAALWQFVISPKPLPVEKADPKKMAFPLPDGPSIAVMPFANMSNDPAQDYLGDGLSEDIITSLSKVGRMLVIARESSFSYKGTSAKVHQIAQKLGVRYVLEGSVRRSGSKLRVTAQLIDAIKGHHLWAERYDRELKEIFSVQDEITKQIITSLHVALMEGEEAHVHARGTQSLDAYLKLLEARDLKARNTKEDNAKARELIEQVLALDPNYAAAYKELGHSLALDVWLGASKSPRESLMKAIELAKKAISLDNSMASAYGLLAVLYTMTRQHEKGIEEAQRAVELDPSSAYSHYSLGFCLNYAGRPEGRIAHLEKAVRLNPFCPNNWLHQLGYAYRETGQHDKAIAAQKKALQVSPKDVLAHIVLTSSLMYAGREEEARAAAVEILRIDPNFSLERFATTNP